MQNDITIIMLTPNRLPKKWAKYHRQVLTEAIGDTAIITISKVPMDWGINLLQTEYGYPNIYKQMLRAAKLATTKYIAMADDDVLYPKQHFQFRPPTDGFYYNYNRWILPTWKTSSGPAIYFYKPRPGNGTMIATRQLVIEAMEARLAADPKLQGYFTKELGHSKRMMRYDKLGSQPFYTAEPVVYLMHDLTADEAAQKHQKAIWPVRAYDIPIWGKAEDVLKKFV